MGRRLGGHASITFGYHRRPPARTRAVAVGRRPDLKADAGQPGAGRRGLCWRYVGLSWTYLGPMLPLCSPMLAHVGPMLA